MLSEIGLRVARQERVLVTTLTKRMAEDLTDYLREHGIAVRYLHSDIGTVERTEIIRDLRLGAFDVLVGINLLREGLDMPEVSLVAILDADKEGYVTYAKHALRLLRPGGLLLADNAFWSGRVLERPEDAASRGIQAFNEYLASSDLLEGTIVPVGDGLAVGVKGVGPGIGPGT